MRSEPGGDCHDDQVGCYERCRASCSSHDQADVPVPGQPIAQINCELVSAQVNTCGGYPWLIYENLGGTLSQTPEIKYQPIPLESDSGDSSFGGDGFSSTTHALQDFELRRVKGLQRPHAAQHRMRHARRTVDRKAHHHQTVDHILHLGFRCPLLHHN